MQMSAFPLFIVVFFILIGEKKEALRGKILISFRMRCITAFKKKQELWCDGTQMGSEVSPSMSSYSLHMEGRSLGEMRYHCVAGASDRNLNKVLIFRFWSHDSGDLDTDEKPLRIHPRLD